MNYIIIKIEIIMITIYSVCTVLSVGCIPVNQKMRMILIRFIKPLRAPAYPAPTESRDRAQEAPAGSGRLPPPDADMLRRKRYEYPTLCLSLYPNCPSAERSHAQRSVADGGCFGEPWSRRPSPKRTARQPAKWAGVVH